MAESLAILLACACTRSAPSSADTRAVDAEQVSPSSSAGDQVLPSSSAGDSESAKLQIGFSLPTQRDERWMRDRRSMVIEAKRRGVALLGRVAASDAASQLAQCNQLIAEGIEVLILAPYDSVAAAQIVDQAVKAGVKVISYERLVMGSPHAYYYISFDGEMVGEFQGQFLTRKVPMGSYILLSGPSSDSNSALFRKGAMKYIKPLVQKGNITVIADEEVAQWQPSKAQAICDKALTAAQGKVDAVLAPNDGTAGGCIRSLEKHGLAGKVVVTGQDAELAAAKRIVEGTQSMTVFKDTRKLGETAIRMAIDLAQGRPIQTKTTVNNNTRKVPALLLKPHLVTRDNLDEQLIESNYLSRAAVYAR
jgi:D-xylose transport system substrate-binding protein